jgi:hypothetical protein
MTVDTKFLLEMFRSEYNNRLAEVIGEADMFDEEGNLLLSPDLKVRHRASGLEYTVDRVETEDGSVQVYLRSPESPRFDPPEEEPTLLGEPRHDEILGEQDPMSGVLGTEELVDDNPQEEVTFVVDQEEFEKEYEVD